MRKLFVLLSVVLVGGMGSPVYGQVDQALICSQTLQEALNWTPSSPVGGSLSSLFDGNDLSSWFTTGPIGVPGSDVTEVSFDRGQDVTLYKMKLIPEANGGQGFEELTVTVENVGGMIINQQVFNLLPTGDVDLNVYFPEGTLGSKINLSLVNHLDNAGGGFAEIEIYICQDGLRPCNTLCPGNGADSDLDGLDDDCENCLNTLPNDTDTDSDGLPDGYEYEQRFDPLSDADGLGFDGDNDGLSNVEECQLQIGRAHV